MPAQIPDSHKDLLTRPIHAVLSTVMPDGQPQSSIVWIDFDGEYFQVSTTLERQKGRNMCANPKVSLLVIDPDNSSRWIAVRGRVIEITPVRAIALADKLTCRYTGKPHFYGDIYPVEQRLKESRVTVRIEPLKVSLDAVFK